LSLLSKENTIIFPAVVALDAWIFQGGFRSLLERWRRFAALSGVAVLYLGVRYMVLGGIGVPKTAQYMEGALTFAQRELTTGRAFLKYFELLIAPVEVTGDYDFNTVPIATAGDWVAWTGLTLVAATIILGLRLLKTQPSMGFGILFFYVAMLPTSNWIAPTSLIMSERSLYLPSLGFCLIVGLMWGKISSATIRRMVATGVVAASVLLCFGHSYIWRDDLTYFRNLVRVYPNNIRGRQAYGIALAEAGQQERAREQFEAGLKIGRNAPLLVGLGQTYSQIDGDCRRARPVLKEAQSIKPADPFAPWLLGGCLEREGRLEEAEAEYRQAIANTRFPDPELLGDWGRTLEKMGRPAEAQEAYRRAEMLR
jgi:tetratricopeptide (TPR) repeat protein